MGLFDFGKKKEAKRWFDAGEAAYNAGDYVESAQCYQKATDLGHRDAMRFLAYQYRFGLGVKQDSTTAYTLYLKYHKATKDDAVLGFVIEMYELGELDGIVDMTDDERFDMAHRAALAGGEPAYRQLSIFYSDGIGCDPNSFLSAYWAYKSYRTGDPYAAYSLGWIFAEGEFFPPVPAYARFFFERSKALYDTAIDNEYPDDLLEYLSRFDLQRVDPIDPGEDYFNLYFNPAITIQRYEQFPNLDETFALAQAWKNGEDENGEPHDVDADEAEKHYIRCGMLHYFRAEFIYGMLLYPFGNDEAVIDEDGELIHIRDDAEGYIANVKFAAETGYLDAMKEIVDECMDEDGVFDDPKLEAKYRELIRKLHGRNYEELDSIEEAELAEDNAQLNGHVRQVLADHEFEGTMVNGKRQHGKFTHYHLGWVYEGEFRDDAPTGKGKKTYRNGDYDEGYFTDGVLHGFGVRYCKDRYTATGDFRDGYRNGFCYVEYESGELAMGMFQNDEPAGLMLFYHSDGTMEAGEFDSEWNNMTLARIKDSISHMEHIQSDGGEFHGELSVFHSASGAVSLRGHGWMTDHRTVFNAGHMIDYALREGVFALRSGEPGAYLYALKQGIFNEDYQLNGEGTTLFISGADKKAYLYTGSMENGRYEGVGIYREPHGSSWCGKFSNGRMVEIYSATLSDGTSVPEDAHDWAMDKLNGFLDRLE